MKTHKINLPLTSEIVKNLTAGEKIIISGQIITARDIAHKRMIENLPHKPIEYQNHTIYYCGPTPAKKDLPIGACGPTTASRMDAFAAQLFPFGYKYMIGKGNRSDTIRDLIVKYEGIYLMAIGGAGALYGQCVTESRCILWEELGTEAVYMLTVKDFPCYVAIDTRGNDIYKERER